jgi:hypothetical protein
MLTGKTAHIVGFHGDYTYDKFGFRAVLGDRTEQIIGSMSNREGNQI